jgi:oligopeptide/dipeptide ABC transporter ATP-binding protein
MFGPVLGRNSFGASVAWFEPPSSRLIGVASVNATNIPQADPSKSEASLFAVEDIVKHFPVRASGRRRGGFVRAVDGVSFSIRKNEVLGLVGESGCGKSTLARLLLKLIPLDRGKVTMDGQDISAVNGVELRRLRRSMQLIFQDSLSAMDPRMRIGMSLEAPLAQHDIGTHEERRERVFQMLSEVGLDETFYERMPSQCSGGQLQRAAIARALVLEPRFLICDEPTSSLDSSVRAQVLNLLIKLKNRFGLTVLMISHDLRVIKYFCDRVAVMYLGQIVEIADRDAIFASPTHPYTRALITASWLEKSPLSTSGEPVRGEPPSPVAPPSGCRFHPRCPIAEERCTHEAPKLETAGQDHLSRCHFRDRQVTPLVSKLGSRQS